MNYIVHSDKFNRSARSGRNMPRRNLEVHRCRITAHVTMALQPQLRRDAVCGEGDHGSWGIFALSHPHSAASGAGRNQRSRKHDGPQTVSPWGCLWTWDSKKGSVVKMDQGNQSGLLKARGERPRLLEKRRARWHGRQRKLDSRGTLEVIPSLGSLTSILKYLGA